MIIMLIKAIVLACISEVYNSTPATKPTACPPQQIPISIAINAVVAKDAFGKRNKSVKQKAEAKPLITRGAFLVLNLSEIQPTMGELMAQVRLRIPTRMPAWVFEK